MLGLARLVLRGGMQVPLRRRRRARVSAAIRSSTFAHRSSREAYPDSVLAHRFADLSEAHSQNVHPNPPGKEYRDAGTREMNCPVGSSFSFPQN
jgi:hypothetical protein